MIKRYKSLMQGCCLLVLINIAPSLYAQADNRAALNEIISAMKGLKTYSYESDMVAVFPNGQQDEMINKIYMDAQHKCLRYDNKTQVVILNKDWFYRADHASNTVSIFNVVTYARKTKRDPEELNNVFKSNNVFDFFLDSVVAKQAKIKSAKIDNDRIAFRFDFGSQSYIKDFEIIYNRNKRLPELIKMTVFYQNSKVEAGKNSHTTVNIVCRNYSGEIPQNVFNTNRYFKIVNGKIALLQYKNYKVSSIL